MVRKGARGVSNHLFGLILACGVCGGALAFAAGMGVDNFSQLAVGNQSDLKCMGGADAKCPCKTGFKKGTKQCDGKTPGGGKIGCPCSDTTSGDVAASGKCATVGKCKADKADGMMPMLPMLPMPMPKMSMPMMMQPNCPPKNNSNATTSTSTVNVARTAADTGGGYDPSCPPESFGAQSGGNFWGSVWDNVNPFASPDDTNDSDTGTDDDTGTTNTNSVWGNLMKSLGISNDSDTDDTDTTGTGSGTNTGTSTTTGGVTSKTGTNTTGSTTTTQTTIDFAKSGSTFTYEAEAEEFETQATTVLDQIKKTLEKLLDIVSKWL